MGRGAPAIMAFRATEQRGETQPARQPMTRARIQAVNQGGTYLAHIRSMGEPEKLALDSPSFQIQRFPWQ